MSFDSDEDWAAQQAYDKAKKDFEVKEICICAAIRLPDGRLFIGHRHSDAINTAITSVEWNGGKKDGVWEPEMCNDQGFITSKNRYVDRIKGLRLQLDAGIDSIATGGYRHPRLFSEDLY